MSTIVHIVKEELETFWGALCDDGELRHEWQRHDQEMRARRMNKVCMRKLHIGDQITTDTFT